MFQTCAREFLQWSGGIPAAQMARRFAPREADWGDLSFLGYLVLLLGLLLFGRWIHSLYEAHAQKKAEWDHVRQVCREHSLDQAATAALVSFLKASRLKNPHRAVTSLAVFDKHVAGPLKRRAGGEATERIRRHLFLKPASQVFPRPDGPPASVPDESGGPARTPAAKAKLQRDAAPPETGEAAEPPADGGDVDKEAIAELEAALAADGRVQTDEIPLGTHLRLRFKHDGAYLPGTLVAKRTDGLYVSLGGNRSAASKFQVGQAVDGLYREGERLRYFRTVLEEVLGAEVPTCRLTHTGEMDELSVEEFIHAGLEVRFGFEVIPAAESMNRLDDIPDHETPRYEGTLRDLSPAACMIEAKGVGSAVEIGDFVRFPLNLGDEEVKVVGQLMRTAPAEGDLHRLVVRFVALEHHVRDRLAMLCFRLRRRTPRNEP
jgi:hypothetical protein